MGNKSETKVTGQSWGCPKELEAPDSLQAKDLLMQRLRRSEMKAEKEGWVSEKEADQVWKENSPENGLFS